MIVNGTFGSVPTTPTDAGKFTSSKQDAGKLQADFLKMLTAQLEHQDPLEPMDNTEMTGQMAQFSSLGEQQKSNDLLQQLISMQSVDQVNAAVGYMGKQVATVGNRTLSENGQATVHFQMPESGAATISLFDESGRLVKSLDPRLFSAGEQSFTISDEKLPKGLLTFSVAIQGAESNTAVTTYETGEVTGVVNNPESGVTLEVNGHSVNLADVRRVEQLPRKVPSAPES
ncbi:MAG: flagellar hook capping protein [Magnetococcales bacterium]|nr:flagellar hook capping protein [Magnetococcales bacterium]